MCAAFKVFEKEDPVGDISAIVSQRLAAMRKLEENPNDPEALAAMYKAQKQMSTWAESKNKPGQFVGKIDPGSPAEVAGLKESDREQNVTSSNVF